MYCVYNHNYYIYIYVFINTENKYSMYPYNPELCKPISHIYIDYSFIIEFLLYYNYITYNLQCYT